MKSKLLIFCLAMLCTTVLGAETPDRIEPPCWWVGMETELQLMLHGRNLRDAKVTTDASVKGLSVTKVTSTDNPDFLFVDVRISDRLKPGRYPFNVITTDGRQYDFDYEVLARRKGSARRESFSASFLNASLSALSPAIKTTSPASQVFVFVVVLSAAGLIKSIRRN